MPARAAGAGARYRGQSLAAVETALAHLRKGLEFADALHHASSRACETFLTVDAKGFARKARRLAITPPLRVPT